MRNTVQGKELILLEKDLVNCFASLGIEKGHIHRLPLLSGRKVIGTTYPIKFNVKKEAKEFIEKFRSSLIPICKKHKIVPDIQARVDNFTWSFPVWLSVVI